MNFKKLTLLTILLLFLTETSSLFAVDAISNWMSDFKKEIKAFHQQREKMEISLNTQVQVHYKQYCLHQSESNRYKYENALRTLRQFQENSQIQELQLRYKKGLSLIKLLYEKVLSLDHHFTGMRTYQNIFKLSNPNQYPKFRDTRKILEDNMKRRSPVVLPDILQVNPFISSTFSLIAGLLGDQSSKSGQKNLDEIACILDFTLKMNDDLSLIHFETAYLQGSNLSLIESCEQLFSEYVKIIDYHVALKTCRMEDDWEMVYTKIDEFIYQLIDENNKQYQHSGIGSLKAQRALVNMEFGTQKVANFVGDYQSFIKTGAQYYKKFDSIINNYDNQEKCISELPTNFNELQYDIQNTIEKFENTYNLPEISGSRMKSLLFGIN